MAYDFHYTPTGTGVISGKEVLEQTEDAINDLGNTAISGVQEALDKAEQALTNSANAVDDAQTALNTANTAYTTAQNAQNTANTAQNTASNALTAAQNAQNDVNALGNRVTTAEGNITQNTTDITNLTTRMGTAEGNITTLQSNVSTAQATANSAQQTANTARQQSYVFRYSSSSVTDNSTIAYSTLDNTDNIKTSDKIIDVDGKIFSVVSVDTTNQTVTVGTALIDLALDGNVVHTSGNETVNGDKVWIGTNIFQQNVTYQRTNFYHQVANPSYILKDTELEKGSLATTHTSYPGLWQDKNGNNLGYIRFVEYGSGRQTAEFRVSNLIKNGALDPTGSEVNCTVNLELRPSGEKSLIPEQNNDINLGTSTNKWKSINGLTPSSLGMPDLASKLDITGYITDLTGAPNVYTSPANGYIILRSVNADILGIIDNTTGMGTISRGSNQTIAVYLPVVSGSSISLYAKCTSLSQAYFIPCQGNI